MRMMEKTIASKLRDGEFTSLEAYEAFKERYPRVSISYASFRLLLSGQSFIRKVGRGDGYDGRHGRNYYVYSGAL